MLKNTMLCFIFWISSLPLFAQNEFKNACVVSAKKDVSDLAIQVIQEGGNAFDAMVITEMGLAVSYPFAGSLGGGGFMVYRLANGESGSLDFREKAPAAAYKDMFLDTQGNVIPNKSTKTALASGVPGNVAGVFEAHRKFGKLPINDLLLNVADFAERGFVVTANQAQRLNHTQNDFSAMNANPMLYTGNFKVGDTIKNLALAQTLKILANKGAKAFYEGELGEKLVQFMQLHHGIITMDDLKNYKPVWRKTIQFDYKEYTLYSMAPPSSGGLALAQMLKTVENYNVKKLKHNSSKYVQLLTEIERRVYADRAHYLGDPDFVTIPITQLLDKKYLKKRMKSFRWNKATPSTEVSHGTFSDTESKETTHYSIVDNYGNAVAVTTTINDAYGSKLYCNELGFFMNNEMDDFAAKPGVPNIFGLIGADANKVEPNKRMLSSMTPTIIEKNGKLFLILGSPGGSTIITSVFQNILNVIEFEKDIDESVSLPRFHHQWLPDEVMLEPNGFEKNTVKELTVKGYSVIQKNGIVIGKVNAIMVKNNTLFSGADPRGDEAASGY